MWVGGFTTVEMNDFTTEEPCQAGLDSAAGAHAERQWIQWLWGEHGQWPLVGKPGETLWNLDDGWVERGIGKSFREKLLVHHVLSCTVCSLDFPCFYRWPVSGNLFYMERYSMNGMSRPFWPIEIPRKWIFKTLRVFRDVLLDMFDVFWCYCCFVFIYYLQSHGFIMEKVKYWMVETQNDQWSTILRVEGTLQTNALDIFSGVRRQVWLSNPSTSGSLDDSPAKMILP